MNQINPEEMYPYITRILQKSGSQVRLGGTVKENQVFDSVESAFFNWDYSITNPRMRQLYERAKTAQWSAADLPWDTDVDLERELFVVDPSWEQADWYQKLSKRDKVRFTIEYNTNLLSNFAHGEHGALVAASQLVTAVPDADSKFYAASQTFDEARHVEVFSRYLHEKIDNFYPCTQNLFNLMQAITVESRWDFKFLGMQLIVEGLAIAAFVNLLSRCREPLLKELFRLVLRDEARHVAFGVIALKDYYSDMSEQERRERQEFVYEACVLMRGRLVSGEAYERMGLDPTLVKTTMRDSEELRQFRGLLFSQIVPNMKKIGLLDGWLAERFAEMEVLHFKDYDADAVLASLIDGTSENSPSQQQSG
ncbi:MAG: ferritin-like domain-containing protein [SAR324 cluster bacterium]|nr:ferritin-like domain-containing protein [SAR324 cluster bacterium]MCZ6628464.1 ferritin-like domain-containing protein [SAR324 cluster bacterium]